MSIKIIKDPANPLGGYAKVIVSDLSVGAPASAHVRITRLEDDQYLSAAGWSTNDARLGPFDLRQEDGAHVLVMGPDVVGQMAPFQQIRVEVLEAGSEAVLKWPEDVAATQRTARRGTVHARKGGVGKVSPTRPAAPAPAPAPTPAPPTPVPEPPEDTPAKSPDEEPENPTQPDPGTKSKEETGSPTGDTDDGKKGKLPMIAAAIVLILILGGAGAYFGLGGDDSSPDDPAVTEESDGNDTTGGTTDNAADTSGCDPAAVKGAGADERWGAAEDCIADGDLQGALQLVETLVAEAYPEAQLQLGKWMDPNLDGDNPMGSKNANTAIRLYDSAKKGGLSEADPLFDNLCKTLEAETGLSEQVTYEKFCQGS